MNRRSGTTLVEVLVSIFVMGIGLLALLTLFPVGALHMAQAIRDDLTTHAGYDAAAIAEAKDLRNDSNILGNGFNNYTYPNPTQKPALQDLSQLPGYDGPSYSVFVDPFGYFGYTGTWQTWVGGSQTYGIPRISPSFVNVNNYAQDTIRWFSLLDDIRFANNGTPDLSTQEIEREGAITWAYLLRRPRANVATDVEMQVVAFNKRPIRLSGDTAQPNEYAFPNAVFDTSANKVTLSWNPGLGQAAPQIRTGGWILDATIETAANGNPVPHGFFYRVTDVNDLGNNTMELQVDGGFREFAQGTTVTGTVIIMDGVAEVFYKGPGWQP
jgi:hypothetical protein